MTRGIKRLSGKCASCWTEEATKWYKDGTQCVKCYFKEYYAKSPDKKPKYQRKIPDWPNAGLKRIFRLYQKGAAKRRLSFDLSIEQFADITSRPCRYCGDVPQQKALSDYFVKGQPIKEKTLSKGQYLYNGIDRVDNSRGYTLDNSAPCCPICNRMKSNLTLSEFLKHIKAIAVYTLKGLFQSS